MPAQKTIDLTIKKSGFYSFCNLKLDPSINIDRMRMFSGL